jgi:hypothetical protein
MKKYAHLDPTIGQYKTFNTREEVIASAVDTVLQFFLYHTHGNPFVEINVNEDGSEVWTAAHDGSSMLSPAEIEAQVKAFLAGQTIPTSTLG